MAGDHFAVGVKPLVALRQHCQRRVLLAGGGDLEQILHPAGLAGAGGEEHGVGDQCRSPVRVSAQFGGPVQPLDGDGQSAATNGHLGRLGEQVGHVLVRSGGGRRQVGGPAHHHIVVEGGEVTVSVAAVLRAGLMDDRRPGQGMAKHGVALLIHHEQPCRDRRLDLAHHVTGPGAGRGVGGGTVQRSPQHVSAHPRVEVFQPPAEHREQALG